MFKTRFISSIVLIILTIGVLFCGGWVTALVLYLLSLKGVQELLRVYDLDRTSVGSLAYIFTTIYYGLLYFDINNAIMPLMIIYLLIVLAIYVFKFPKYNDKQMAMVFLAFFYVSVMLSYVYKIRSLEHGILLVCLIYVSSWGNDMFAYLVGVKLGKHKMSPKLSPNKSIEGAIGGILGSAMFGALFGIIFNKYVKEINFAVVGFALIGALGALPAIVGDLAASAIKRDNDVKDYGKLIPGHGGVLDRFDSIIFTAPIVYYLIMIVYVIS